MDRDLFLYRSRPQFSGFFRTAFLHFNRRNLYFFPGLSDKVIMKGLGLGLFCILVCGCTPAGLELIASLEARQLKTDALEKRESCYTDFEGPKAENCFLTETAVLVTNSCATIREKEPVLQEDCQDFLWRITMKPDAMFRDDASRDSFFFKTAAFRGHIDNIPFAEQKEFFKRVAENNDLARTLFTIDSFPANVSNRHAIIKLFLGPAQSNLDARPEDIYTALRIDLEDGEDDTTFLQLAMAETPVNSSVLEWTHQYAMNVCGAPPTAFKCTMEVFCRLDLSDDEEDAFLEEHAFFRAFLGQVLTSSTPDTPPNWWTTGLASDPSGLTSWKRDPHDICSTLFDWHS